VFTGAEDIAAYGGATIVRNTSDELYICGHNDYGQLGTTGRNLGSASTPNWQLELITI
jgi:alpha-tubulin suppressor-like RCC1 family protein